MKTIPGGRCAVVRYLGSHNRLGESIYPLYREWLPTSGEELRDYPLYFQYLNLLPDIAEADLVTDIYLPRSNQTRRRLDDLMQPTPARTSKGDKSSSKWEFPILINL
jgi:hypothetical protein